MAEHLLSDFRKTPLAFLTWRPARSWAASAAFVALSTLSLCRRTPRCCSPEAPTRPRWFGTCRPFSRQRARALEPLPRGGVTPLWADLESADAAKADQAIWTLVRAGNQATAYLAAQLKPVKEDPLKRIPQLLADLDNDKFAVRDAASRELEELLPEAEAAPRHSSEDKSFRRGSSPTRRSLGTKQGESNRSRTTSPPPCPRSPRAHRHRRSPRRSRETCRRRPEARLTQHAKAAVDRLAKRATVKP